MSHPGVDYTRTVSNHIIDIIDVLGIEAARAALLKVLHILQSVLCHALRNFGHQTCTSALGLCRLSQKLLECIGSLQIGPV